MTTQIANSYLDLSANYLNELVENGDFCPLKVYIFLVNLQKKTDQLLENVKKAALKEARKYNDEPYCGYYVKVQESGVRYHYNESDEYNDVVKQIDTLLKPLNDQKKELEKKLKTGFLDTTTGEYVKAVSKSSTEIIKLTAK